MNNLWCPFGTNKKMPRSDSVKKAHKLSLIFRTAYALFVLRYLQSLAMIAA